MDSELKGLTTKEAESQMRKFGKNVIEAKQEGAVEIFLKQFLNPLIYLLIIAGFLSLLLRNYTDCLIIFIIILINTFLGFFQQYRVNQEFKKLSALISSDIEVLRDGERKLIKKSLIVPGDIVFLKLGDKAPADGFIVKQEDFQIDESALTGESMVVTKKINSKEDIEFKEGIIYSGTNIEKGSGVIKVFATGNNSKFGNIAKLSIQTKKVSEYELNLKNLSRRFLFISIVALAGIFLAHALIKQSDNLIDIFFFTVAISITIIPEALPIVANLTLSKSAFKLGKKGVIVKRAAAIEDLGNIDLVCTDKTGTLTKNEIAVIDVHKSKNPDFLKYASLLSETSTDQFDTAVKKYLDKNGFKLNKSDDEKIKEGFEDVPFDPAKKVSSRKFLDFKIIKGAPESIINLTNYKDKDFDQLLATNASKGWRALSLALEKNGNLEYLGTFFMFDEIKEDVEAVIKRAEKLGIEIKIITGDSEEVSKYVGYKVGLIKSDDEVIESKDLKFDDSVFFEEQVASHSIFTRCDPIQKYKILEALQKKHFLGYIGDGINDSPSLKLANVSIVVNSATDIAKENADLIMLRKNLNVLIDGISEGRKAFENIDKYLRQTLVGNFGNFFTIGIVSLFLSYLPMLPIQILISNLLTDIPSLAIADDNVDHNELKRPKQHNLSGVIRNGFWLAVLSSAFDLVFFLIILNNPVYTIQTLWFAFSTVSEILVLFSLRTKKGIFSKGTSKPSLILGFSIIFTLVICTLLFVVGSNVFSVQKVSNNFIVVIFAMTILYVIANELLKKVIWKDNSK